MRTVFICGASSDIGLATVQRYLGAGWKVIAHYRTTRPELQALEGPDVELWQADLSDTSELEAKLGTDPSFFNRADALINLAAEIMPVRFETATVAQMVRALSVNLLPGLLFMQAMGPSMVERGFGRIVHASSIGVKFGGGSDSFAYSLSKHAQEFIPKACRQWAANNVYVNVLRVGVTDTRIHASVVNKDIAERIRLIPAQRLATPSEIAQTVFWLGSETNGFTTSEVITASGGE